jgi:phosphoserine/homoserine phosphotransferase
MDDLCAAEWKKLPDSERNSFVNIRTGASLGDQRDQYVLQEHDQDFVSERDLVMVAFDVEGTLMPEAWLELQKKTGLEELKRTTAHEPDYDKLMQYRFDVLRKNGIKLQDMKDIVKDLKPLPGTMEFLEWLKPLVPRILLLTDTFEEYALPMFEALGYPTVFCNSLVCDEEGYMIKNVMRLKDQKRKAVESFQRLNFRVIAVGDSFNDVSMLTAAERGILIYPSEKVVKAHPEFPVARDHYDLRVKIGRILSANMKIMPRELAPVLPINPKDATRSMWLLICNVAGTLAPEPWVAVQKKTGIEELKATTAQESDYSKLMMSRASSLRRNGVKLQDVVNIMEDLDVLPGAKDFMEWLKPIVPRAFILTDSFEEYALPMFHKLGHPMVFCNFLEADQEGYMNKLVVRVKDQKLKTVQELQRLNFRIIAVGSSFNDVPMLSAAEQGILFRPSEQLKGAHPDVAKVSNHDELKAKILEIVGGGEEPMRKKAKML